MGKHPRTPFSRLLRKAFFIFLAMGLLGFVVLGIVNLDREQRDTRENLSVLSGFLASATQAFFDDLGHGLQPLGQLLQRVDVLRQPENARPYLLKFQERYPQIGAMAVFNIQGRMLINTARKPGEPLPDFRRTPAYLKPFRLALNAPSRYTVGRPEYGQVIHEWRFPFRYTARDDAGKPMFMIQAAIPLESGMNFLRAISLPSHSLVGILREDGLQQARWPLDDPDKVFGRNLNGPLVKAVRKRSQAAKGVFTGYSPWMYTEQKRLGAYTRLSSMPMYAYVSIPYNTILSKWWEHNSPVLAVFLVFVAIFGAIAFWVTVEERQHSEELLSQARRDSLTGLANRAGAEDLLSRQIQQAMQQDKVFALMFFDLDRFKDINDALGHSSGDQLLVEVGKRAKGVLRQADILARLGGDEFLAILPGSTVLNAEKTAKRIIQAFEAPFLVEMQRLKMSCSVGIAVFPEHGTDKETLLKHADTAMYEAKRLGRSGYACYEGGLGERIQQRIKLASRMHDAFANGEFSLHYQPIVELANGQIVAAEALLRWTDSDGVSHNPAEFIPIAEESGFILPLGEWILQTACKQARAWQQQGLDIQVSVNLSTRQFLDPDLPKKVLAILEECVLPASKLELEITEGAAMLDPESSVDVLGQLKSIGVQIAIDDFGTGYSSLSYLKRLPADTIKIDKSFVNGVSDETDDRAIVHSILALARALDKQTIAEGIETAGQRQELETAGCRLGQGYLFSHPLAAEQFTAQLVRLINLN